MDGLLLGMPALCKPAGGLFEPIAPAAKLGEDTVAKEVAQNGGSQGDVTGNVCQWSYSSERRQRAESACAKFDVRP